MLQVATFLGRQITAPGIIRLVSLREAGAFLILLASCVPEIAALWSHLKNDNQGQNLSTLLPPAHTHALQFLIKDNFHLKWAVAVTCLSGSHVGLIGAAFLKKNAYGQM